eukprot:CAMPEP_0194289132 /NCGR_PEP_ID=MMETSP0169-20130528/38412_1 /TAXON_ID=218684 /ORGANISM="Corethron pennatum, Strain L29A3" /LENGTH=319 /DNA_ID=CAMNT_0039036335 /DNA_START=174 /DNA_END=1133 /DNA_ORIENTATION=-
MTELGKFAMLSQKQVRDAESEITFLKASKIAEMRASGEIVSEAKRRANYSEAEAKYFKSQLDESQKVIEMKNRELNTLTKSNKESKATITNIKRRYDHAKEEHKSEIRDFHTQLETGEAEIQALKARLGFSCKVEKDFFELKRNVMEAEAEQKTKAEKLHLAQRLATKNENNHGHFKINTIEEKAKQKIEMQEINNYYISVREASPEEEIPNRITEIQKLRDTKARVADLCDEIAELEESVKETQMRAKDSEDEVKYLQQQLRESQKREKKKAQKLRKNAEISSQDLNFNKIIKDMKNENDDVRQEVSGKINYLLKIFD